jgi:hypothetical protein
MHESIQHVGSVTRLDCWRLVVKEKGYQDLDAFALAEPSFEELQSMAGTLAKSYVANTEFRKQFSADPSSIDKVRANMLLRQEIFLLYGELLYAMNRGDIGRVETCFLPWIWIFQACGKHKYATYLRKYLRDVHFIYPEGLKKAIRMHILINPTGKPGHFRGVDWLVELNNLYIKVSI